MSMLERVRREIPDECLVGKCREGRLSAEAGSEIKDAQWVDMERLRKDDGITRCDCPFFGHESDGNQGWVAAIEFKASKPNAGAVCRQLQAGADYASQFLKVGSNIRFRPVVIHGGSVTRKEHRRFKEASKKISFLGLKEPVRVVFRRATFPME